MVVWLAWWNEIGQLEDPPNVVAECFAGDRRETEHAARVVEEPAVGEASEITRVWILTFVSQARDPYTLPWERVRAGDDQPLTPPRTVRGPNDDRRAGGEDGRRDSCHNRPDPATRGRGGAEQARVADQLQHEPAAETSDAVLSVDAISN